MNIGKPPGGFRVVVEPQVITEIKARNNEWPGLQDYWNATVERLRSTGHREGSPVDEIGKGYRVFVTSRFDIFDIAQLPKITTVYLVLGDTITFHLVKID